MPPPASHSAAASRWLESASVNLKCMLGATPVSGIGVDLGSAPSGALMSSLQWPGHHLGQGRPGKRSLALSLQILAAFDNQESVLIFRSPRTLLRGCFRSSNCSTSSCSNGRIRALAGQERMVTGYGAALGVPMKSSSVEGSLRASSRASTVPR
jgi:hypothetical protein